MVDPSHCPIPPGFYLVDGDGISDDFDIRDWRTVEYSDSTDSYYWSLRWKNKNVRSANIVAGFQFKIENGGLRWTDDYNEKTRAETAYEYGSGDVNLKLPRCSYLKDDGRGVYMLQFKYYLSNHEVNGFPTIALAGKEYPHPTTYSYSFMNHGFEKIPRRNIASILDGNWHGFVAAVWNDYNNDPTVALWYNHKGTYDWNDFILLGFSRDAIIDINKSPPKNAMEPGPQLIFGIEEAQAHLFSSDHVLEIRIDDVPDEYCHVRDMYGANVHLMYDPLPRPAEFFCQTESIALYKAQVEVDVILKEIRDLQDKLRGLQDDNDPQLTKEEIMAEIKRIRDEELPIPVAKRDTARSIYQTCMKIHPPRWSLRNLLKARGFSQQGDFPVSIREIVNYLGDINNYLGGEDYLDPPVKISSIGKLIQKMK